MPRNLAFFLITIATFLPGLPTLRANKISNGKESMSVRLLEMRQNITDQQLEFLVQKIALLEAKCLPKVTTASTPPFFSWENLFQSKFDPSNPALHIAGVDNVYLPYQIFGISLGLLVAVTFLALGVSNCARKSSYNKQKQQPVSEAKRGEENEEEEGTKKKKKKEEVKGEWMAFRPNMYDAFAVSALYQGHKFSLAKTCGLYGFYFFFNIMMQFTFTYFLLEIVWKQESKMELSFDKTYCSVPTFVIFFSVFLFTSAMLLSVFDTIRRAPHILCGKKYRIKGTKEIIVHGHVVTQNVKTVYEVKRNCNAWHIIRRIIVVLLAVGAELGQMIFIMHVGIKFLALSSNITGLILSALKLTFIIQIDENLYKMLSACKWIKSKNEFKLSKLEYFVPSLFANCETMMKSSRKEGKEEDAEYSCSLFSLFICFEGFLQLFINLAFAFVISVGYITWVQDHVGCSRCPGGPYCENFDNSTILIDEVTRAVLTPFGIYWPTLLVISMVIMTVTLIYRLYFGFCCRRENLEHRCDCCITEPHVAVEEVYTDIDNMIPAGADPGIKLSPSLESKKDTGDDNVEPVGVSRVAILPTNKTQTEVYVNIPGGDRDDSRADPVTETPATLPVAAAAAAAGSASKKDEGVDGPEPASAGH